ncbi:hypothetical protein Pint_35952 [Pistacia integerrima]|uniref:Uncharacterized protein n=1 Tax=Pistacia integerrima TaxID=434235 RepID=A0ACC0XYV2_9ROSI|nr:hypothetical protein Pint_35952 [Pistacia integerrima]
MGWWALASATPSCFSSSYRFSSSFPNAKTRTHAVQFSPSYRTILSKKKRFIITNCTTSNKKVELESSSDVDCVGTGTDMECVVSSVSEEKIKEKDIDLVMLVWEWTVLVSPFFFWGTAMVAMKEVLPKAGTFFVAAFRLIPAGLLLITFASSQRRSLPSGLKAWFSIVLFALVDAFCFQGFLAQGLQRTSAGLGSVIIDSQPLSVAVLASLFFGESIGLVGAAGLAVGVIGLLLLEVNTRFPSQFALLVFSFTNNISCIVVPTLCF